MLTEAYQCSGRYASPARSVVTGREREGEREGRKESGSKGERVRMEKEKGARDLKKTSAEWQTSLRGRGQKSERVKTYNVGIPN